MLVPSEAPFLPSDDGQLYDRQPGETAKNYSAFCCYRDLPPAVRSLPRAAKEYGKSVKLLEVWSAQFGWVARAQAWDAVQDQTARRSRLDEIEAANRQDIRVAEAMLDLVERHLAQAARGLDTSPHALSEWVKTATGVRRIALGVADDRPTVEGDPGQRIQFEVRALMADLPAALVLDAQRLAIEVAKARNRARLGEAGAAASSGETP